MLKCINCGVFFLTDDGLQEHDIWCIGYEPIKLKFSELSKANAHTTHTHTHTHTQHALTHTTHT